MKIVKSILLGFLLLCSNAFSLQFNEECFVIGDFTDGNTLVSYLSHSKNTSGTGLSVSLKYEPSTKQLYLNTSSNQLSFKEFLGYLESYLSRNSNDVFPLFIDYNGPMNWLNDEFSESELQTKTYHKPEEEGWPDIDEIKSLGKQLIIFTFNENSQESKVFNYAWKYMAEFPFTSFPNSIFEGYYTNGSIQNELLLIRDFTADNLEAPMVPEDWADIKTNTFLIDHILNCWLLSGKKPNFIFYSEIKDLHTFKWLGQIIMLHPAVNGSIHSDEKPLNMIYWQEDAKYVTTDNFSFPVIGGHNLELQPYKSGYEFTPKSIKLDISDNSHKPTNIVAHSLKLEEDITAYFSFNNEIKNRLQVSNVYKYRNISYLSDLERGVVLKMTDSSQVILDKATDFGLNNSSFTISMFFKSSALEPDGDYCILGSTGSGYRKGLHINIRSGKPYLGFYNNDLSSFAQINANEWYHIIIRYDEIKKEQSIFINTERAGSSRNRQSYIGDSEIILGESFTARDNFTGYLDDLCIWSRALSDDEIKKVYVGSVRIEKTNFQKELLLILTALFFIVIFLIIRKAFSKRKSGNKVFSKEYPKEQVGEIKNAILLFGTFTVIDKDGKDISSAFPPKVKQLLLIILFHSLKSRKGISSQKITSTIWHGFSTEKATNNRGVTFNKLRKALSNLEGIELIYEDGYWKASISDQLVYDYGKVWEILSLRNPIHLNQYHELFSYSKRGRIVESLTWDWLDEFRSEITYDIIDKLLEFARLLAEDKKKEQLVTVSSVILSLDILNEEALHVQLVHFIDKGNMNKAKYLFDKFRQNYFEHYDEKFGFSLQQFIVQDNKTFS